MGGSVPERRGLAHCRPPAFRLRLVIVPVRSFVPLHGFRGVDDYWHRASAKPHLHAIGVPALVFNARNDPFVPGISLAGPQQAGAQVTLWQPDRGGHIGFPAGGFPGHVRTMPNAVCDWLGAAD